MSDSFTVRCYRCGLETDVTQMVGWSDPPLLCPECGKGPDHRGPGAMSRDSLAVAIRDAWTARVRNGVTSGPFWSDIAEAVIANGTVDAREKTLALRDQIAELEADRDAALCEHIFTIQRDGLPIDDPLCVTCGVAWPCPTALALGVVWAQ